MDLAFPYARYVCPCSESTHPSAGNKTQTGEDPDTPDDRPFDPHGRHANYVLYPIDHLLYCSECDQPRCPRCWTEEVTYWYCPSCQFEVPSTGVKGDGNRCMRHCYDCPTCESSLSIVAVKSQSTAHLKPDNASIPAESYILRCPTCSWSSLDIGVRLTRATKITEQLNKLWKERTSSFTSEAQDGEQEIKGSLSHESAFDSLATFYKDQLSGATDQGNSYSAASYNSPGNLARIMSLYGGLSYDALKKSREKPQPMREARSRAEGQTTYTANNSTMTASDAALLTSVSKLGIDATASTQQRLCAPRNHGATMQSDLWPTAARLRTRRGKRCRTCRQILVRPDNKVGSMRFKIRLLAVNYIQRLALRPLHPLPNSSSSSAAASSAQPAAFHVRAEPRVPHTLRPHSTHQWVLTVRNPVFESVRVTLATPGVTPGRVASRVTILCPSFTVGPAGDMWDEALSTGASGGGAKDDGSRRAAMESLTGQSGDGGERQPEAGKVWERTRNSTSVVVEIVPGVLPGKKKAVVERKEDGVEEAAEEADETSFQEDDDVLEIPIYVRAEWEADAHETEALHADDGGGRRKGVERVSKELAYWCVLGVGRIEGA